MRLFIAAPVPESVRKKLVEIKRDFPEFSAKWVEKKNLHITLVFVGEISEADKVDKISEILGKVNNEPIKLRTDGIALFPDEHKARVLAVSLTGETEKIQTLAEDVERRLREAKIGFDEKPLHPHITLARLKRVHPRKRRSIRQKADSYKVKEETFVINEIALLESELTSSGPIYKTLRAAPLAKG